MWTSCAWIIFADSPPPGTCRPGRRRPSPESGYPVRVRTSSARSRESWGLCRLLPRTWGVITPDVRALRDQFQLPGMRILQFAFDGHADNPYLPHNYIPNTVVYTGTHDNATTRGWFEALPEDQRRNMWNYLKRPAGNSDEVAWELIRLAWSSVAALAMAPLQDLLDLGAE